MFLLATLLIVFVPSPAVAQSGDHVPRGAVVDFMEPGWFGAAEEEGAPLGFAAENGGFHVVTGPATGFFHVGNADTAAAFREVTGDYTVRAMFREQFMANGQDAQPYGVAIASERVDTPATTFLYCAAHGNGTFIVGGASPGLKPFRVTGPQPIPHPAVHKAAAADETVTQEIALSVRNGGILCSINGALVASYGKSTIVGPGKLASTGGVYGVYVGHNMDVFVTGLNISRP
jgi:hypothetical protein